MDFLELAKERYSVRDYADRPVEREKLEKILEAGNVVPTAVNAQPQRIYVLESEESLKKLAELTRCGFNAKTVLLFTYREDEAWSNPLEEGICAGVEDVSIVATHVMLEAWELGIGSCWVNYFPNTKLEKAFGIPAGEKSVLLMPLGYPADGSQPSPKHSACRDISETVRYI